MPQSRISLGSTSKASETSKVTAHLRSWILVGSLLLLGGCGGGGDIGANTLPIQLAGSKKVVIGSPAQIAEKRDATKSAKKSRRGTSVLHNAYVNGVAEAQDAPHPFIMSSGQILLGTKQVGAVQVEILENAQGKVSNVIAATFQSSDPAVVSTVRADASHPNALLLTMTGKKGNSFITSYDQTGNAISKFMVLAAEPREDVLVVSDPSVHPTLCMIVPDKQVYEYCDFSSSTDFDQGNTGTKFNIDDYLNFDARTKPAILFDDDGYSKINSSDLDSKRAIYFEAIDTLFILRRDGIKKTLAPIYNNGRQISQDKNALIIERVATQKEFNDYIDFGGVLTASLLRNPNQTEVVNFDILAGKPAKGELSAVVLQDGRRLSVTESTLLGAVNNDTSAISQRVYTMRQEGQLASVSPMTCTIKGSDGFAPSIAFTSFHSDVTTKLSGKFLWNGGKPDIELDINPYANIGGQVAIESKAGAGVSCSIELRKIPISEYVLPLFGSVEIDVPLSATTEFGVKASGKVVLVTPRFNISSKENIDQAGKVGVSYTPAGGLKSDFDLKTSISANRLGLAKGTDLDQKTAETSVGLELSTGLDLGIEMSAKVKVWLYKAEVNANVGSVFVGLKIGGEYKVDKSKQTSKRTSSNESGIGVFFNLAPTVSVKTSFFSASYNLFNIETHPIWIYKFEFVESAELEEPFAPSEKTLNLAFLTCRIGRPGNPEGNLSQVCYQIPLAVVGPVNVEGQSSSEVINFQKPLWSGRAATGFKYYYTYIDKPTGQLQKVRLPVTVDAAGGLSVQKAGVSDILYEYIISDRHVVSESNVEGTFTHFQGCNYWLNPIGGSPVYLNAYDCSP